MRAALILSAYLIAEAILVSGSNTGLQPYSQSLKLVVIFAALIGLVFDVIELSARVRSRCRCEGEE